MILRQGLTARITIVFVLFAGLLLAGIDYLTYRSARASMETAAISELVSMAIEKEWQIDQWTEAQETDIETLSRSPVILAALRSMKNPRSTHAAIAQTRIALTAELLPRTLPQMFNALAVIDHTGKITAATGFQPDNTDAATEEFFLKGRQGTYIHKPHNSAFLQKPAISFSTPLHDTDGTLLGVVTGWSDLSKLNEILRHRTGLHRSDDAFLLNEEGLLVTQPRLLKQSLVLRDKISTETIRHCLAGNNGVALAKDIQGSPSVIVYRWLSRHKMGMFVKISQQEAFAPVHDFGDTIMVISLLALLASSGVAVLLARTITHPVRALRAGVARFSRENLFVPLSATADDEVAQLTKEFNSMAAAILEKESELRANAIQLEERVQERTRVLQQQANLLDLAHNAITVTDLDGKILFWNNGATEIYGWRKREAIGQHNHAMLFSVFPIPKQEIIDTLLQSGRWEGELLQTRRDGASIVVSTRKALQRDELGQPLAILSINTDITAQKEAENVLRTSEQRTRMIVDSAYDAFIAMDEYTRIIDWNRQAEVMFGWRREEVMGKPVNEIITPERHRSKYLCEMQRLIATGTSVAIDGRVEIVALRRSGREFMLELIVSPIRQGNAMTYSAFLRDITERKRAQQELQAAKDAAESAARAKSEFLANMSHEIRTPMNGIIGLTKLVLKSPLTEQQREYIAMIDASAASLLRLVNDILDFSKIEARKLELDIVNFDVREMIGDCLKAFSASVNEKGLALTHQVMPEVPVILRGDPGRINQIILNLVSNAIKFTNRGEIAVRLAQESLAANLAMMRLSVSDTGIGITKEKQTHIFNAFAQADSSTTRIYGGTGLGLTIVSQLTALMGGRIWVESEPGAGTTFHLTLQLELPRDAPAESGRMRSRPVKALAKPTRRLTVLIAEDHPINQTLIREIVAERGHAFAIAENGIEVLNMLDRDDFDLILMDGQMPEMDGYQAAAEIRRREVSSGRHIPIIAVTAHAMPQDRELCLAAGMDDYVAKPIDPDELIERIERLTATTEARPPAEPQCRPQPQIPSPAPAAPVVDFALALNRVRGKRALLNEMARVFLEDLPASVNAIQDAVGARNGMQLERAAHRLKGAAAAISAVRLTEVAARLEQHGKRNEIAQTESSVRELETSASELSEALEIFIGDGQ